MIRKSFLESFLSQLNSPGVEARMLGFYFVEGQRRAEGVGLVDADLLALALDQEVAIFEPAENDCEVSRERKEESFKVSKFQ